MEYKTHKTKKVLDQNEWNKIVNSNNLAYYSNIGEKKEPIKAFNIHPHYKFNLNRETQFSIIIISREFYYNETQSAKEEINERIKMKMTMWYTPFKKSLCNKFLDLPYTI